MRQKPYSSPLWDHVDLICKMRRQHEPWQAIAKVLKERHNVGINYRSVQAFFKRTMKRKALPMGWEPSSVFMDKWPTREEADELLR